MAKAISGKIKLQIVAGKATPAPPVGPALGQYGVPIGDFVNKFNEATKAQMGTVVPVIITVYEDRSYDFIVKSPPASILIKKVANLDKGSAIPNVDKVGSLTQAQLAEIVEIKKDDLNTQDLEAAKRIIAGTARSMGVTITD